MDKQIYDAKKDEESSEKKSQTQLKRTTSHRRCAYCYESESTFPDRRFFKFPKDLAMCKKWTLACGRPYLLSKTVKQLSSSSFVCAKHFDDSDFASSKKFRLRTTAFPHIHSVDNQPSTSAEEPISSHEQPSNSKCSLITKMRHSLSIKFSSEEKKDVEKTDGLSPDISYNVSSTQNKRKIDEVDHITTSMMELVQYETDDPIHSTPKRRKLNEADCSSLGMPSVLSSILSKHDISEGTDLNQSTPKSFKKAARNVTPKTMKIRSLSSQLYWIKRRNICEKKSKKLSNVLKQIRPLVSSIIYNFIEAQLKNQDVSVYSRRWSIVNKGLALQLYLCSPRAYATLCKYFLLPSQRTLQKSVSSIPVQPGFIQPVFETLNQLAPKMKTRDRYCIISLDEMKIEPGLSYNEKDDVIIGHENYGSEIHLETTKIATHALVFMVRGVCSKWKQVIGSFLSANTAPANILKDLISIAVQKLLNCNFTPVAVVCDMGANNQKLYRNELEVTIEKPFFEIKNHKIYAIFDPPHLLKCLRNNLYKYNVTFDSGKTARWRDIVNIQELDSKLSHRMIKKVTKQHVVLNSFNKMSVKKAVQVFSNSVAAALNCVSVLKQEPSLCHTADFCGKVNDIFDSVNSRMLKHKTVPLLSAVTSKSQHITTWKAAEDFFKDIKFDTDKTIPSIEGWQLTFSAFLKMAPELLDCIPFIMMSRFNQDALENFFSQIRRKGGNNDHPTAKDFLYRLRLLLAQNLISAVRNTNSEEDNDSPLVSSKFFSQSPDNSEHSLVIDDSMQICSTNLDLHMEENIFEENAAAYIAGYLAKKLLQQHPCENCKTLLVLNEENPNYAEKLNLENLFIYFKEYDNVSKGLLRPTKEFRNTILQLGAYFSSDFPNLCSKYGVKKKLMSLLEDVDHSWFNCSMHYKNSWEYVLSLYIRTMIHHKIKQMSIDHKQQTKEKRKEKKKLKKLK